MYTYQDYLNVPDNEASKMQFVKDVISAHRGTELFDTARIADDYTRHRNTTIVNYQKLLYKMSGEAVPDNYSANYKLPSNFFYRFIVQEAQYLLGNGVGWQNEASATKVGEDFDQRIQELALASLWGGVSFGFFNRDHLEVFNVLEFAPLYDENNGALMAGVRFWQIAQDKPLRAVFYELDGYTDYLWDDEGVGKILKDKRPYKQTVRTSLEGTEILNGENYPSFPIIPLFANYHHQSEIIGLREEIDAYDLIQSGFANDLDDCSQIYWTLENAGGMDDIDLRKFIERMHVVKAAVVGDSDGARAEAHTLDVPYAAREAILTRLENSMYKDFMALNTETIASGSVVTAQIEAAYEPLNAKADMFEMCIHDFLNGLMTVAGFSDNPSFTRSKIINATEDVQLILQVADHLPDDYVVRKILTILGDGDKADEIIKQLEAESLKRFSKGKDEDPEDENEEESEEETENETEEDEVDNE